MPRLRLLQRPDPEHTEADLLRDWMKQTQGHEDICGCAACCWIPEQLTIPAFADCPGDSHSEQTVDQVFR